MSGGVGDGAARTCPGRGVAIDGLASMVRRRAVATALKTSKGIVLPINGMANMGMSGSTNAAAIFSAAAWDKGPVSGDMVASKGGGDGDARAAAAAATGEPTPVLDEVVDAVRVALVVAAVVAAVAVAVAVTAVGFDAAVAAGGEASRGKSSRGLGERRGRVGTGGGAVCCGGGV